MTNEHQGQSIYENGRFRLRIESDNAIIDELEVFPPIMVTSETCDGSEPLYADRNSVLHILNQLADTNPNEERHFYLKYRLDKVHRDNYVLRKQLKPIQETCNKYHIPITDLPELLEEYITLDNEEYEEKLRERTI